MELTFTKSTNGFIADYLATTHFNLHIEGGGRVLLYKRTSGEKGDLLANIPSHGVLDIDIAVNFEATYTIVLEKRADVVVTTKDGEVINGVMPIELSRDVFDAKIYDDRKFLYGFIKSLLPADINDTTLVSLPLTITIKSMYEGDPDYIVDSASWAWSDNILLYNHLEGYENYICSIFPEQSDYEIRYED